MPPKPAYTFVKPKRSNRPVSQYHPRYNPRYPVFQQDYRPLDSTVARRTKERNARLARAEQKQEQFRLNWISNQRRRYGYDPHWSPSDAATTTNMMVSRFGRNRQAALDRQALLATQRAQQHYLTIQQKKTIATKHAVAKAKLAMTRKKKQNQIAKKRTVYNVYPPKKRWQAGMTCHGCGRLVRNCDC